MNAPEPLGTGAVDRICGALGDHLLACHRKSAQRVYIDIPPDYVTEASALMFEDIGARLQIATGVDTAAGIEVLYHWALPRTAWSPPDTPWRPRPASRCCARAATRSMRRAPPPSRSASRSPMPADWAGKACCSSTSRAPARRWRSTTARRPRPGPAARAEPRTATRPSPCPGRWPGSHALESYGTKGLPDVLAPSIRIAEDGFLISPTLAAIIADNFEAILADPALSSLLCPEGLPLEAGARLRNPELAQTLRRLGEGGADVFYRGEIAGRIVAAMAAGGGLTGRA